MNKKLIIWDFDGVIADTEKLWLQVRLEKLNKEFNLNWDMETTNKYIGGMADKTKRKVLNGLGIITDDLFWEETLKTDINKIHSGICLTENIEDIFKLKEYKQCIATGGIYSKTELKIKSVGIEKYFNRENIFTVDMVEKGKPEPDLFLLAAKTIGYKPEDCIVIEDSIAGLTAAIKANMTPIAFTGSDICQNNAYKNKVKELGIKYIFDDMNKIKELLIKETL